MKNMSLIVILTLTLCVLAGGSFIVLTALPAGERGIFAADGYVLTGEDERTEEGVTVSRALRVTAGTEFKTGKPFGVTFKDAEGRRAALSEAAFIHYEDGSLGVLGDGVLMDPGGPGTDFVNHYGISPGTMIENTGSGYAVEYAGGRITLNSLMIKLKGGKLLIAAGDLKAETGGDREREFEGYVEVSYVDENVIKLAREEETVYTVSAECAVTADGTRIDLSRRIIGDADNPSMYLEQLVVDADDNIDLTRSAKSAAAGAAAFEPPDFNIIDGEDGESGGAGEPGGAGSAGQAGGAGESGESGEAGEAGQAGSAGSAGGDGGAGQAGRTGATVGGGSGGSGGSGSDDPVSAPGSADTSYAPSASFDGTDGFAIGPGSVSGLINITDERTLLTGDMKLTLTNLNTGEKYMPDPPYPQEGIYGEGVMEVGFAYSGLGTGAQYLLRLSSDYAINGMTFNRDLIYKVFVTDDLGLTLQKLPAEENELSFRIKKEGYSGAESASVVLTRADGSSDTLTANLTLGDATVRFTGLEPNAEYRAELVNIVYKDANGATLNAATGGEAVSALTLKRMPTTASAAVNVISNIRDGSFSFQATGFEDPDGGITGYRYETVKAEDGTLAASVESRGTEPATLGTNGTAGLERNTDYKVRAVALFRDNEKLVEVAGGLSGVFAINTKPLPMITFEPAAADVTGVAHDNIVGKLTITEVSGGATLLDSEPLYLTIKDDLSRTAVRKEYTNIASLKTEGNKYTIDGINVKDLNGNKGLLKNRDHYFTVEGTVNLGDGNPAAKMVIGTVVQRTRDPAAMTASLSLGSGANSVISVNLSLENSGSAIEDYDMSTIERLEFNLYKGNIGGSGNATPFASGVLLDTNPDEYVSTLKEKYYGANPGVAITEADLGIPVSVFNQEDTDTFTLELSRGYDYTGYAENYITFTNNRVYITKNEPAPTLTGRSNAFTVTRVVKGNAAQVGVDWSKFRGNASDPAYRAGAIDANTVLGYSVRPSNLGFNSNVSTVETFAYTMWKIKGTYQAGAETSLNVTAGDLGDTSRFEKVNEFAFTKNDITNNQFPYLTVFFDDVALVSASTTPVRQGATNYYTVYLSNTSGAMRGEQYFFTLNAVLNLGDSNPAYRFPEDDESDLNTPAAAVHSVRLDAPKQDPKFEFYPWKSGEENTKIKYRLTDYDLALGTVGSDEGKMQIRNAQDDRVGALSRSGGLTFAEADLFDTAGLAANAGNEFKAAGGGLYKAVISGSPYRLAAPTLKQVFGGYFEAKGGENAFPGTGASAGASAVLGENRLQITITGLTAEQLKRVAAVEATVSLNFSPSESLVNCTRILSFDADTGTASLPYANLTANLANRISEAESANVSVKLYYDDGETGFADVPAASDQISLYAIQLFAETGGRYLIPRTGAGENGSRIFESATAGGSLFNLTGFSESGGIFTYKSYLSVFDGGPSTAYRFGITDNGVLGVSDSRHITVKRLEAKQITASPIVVNNLDYSPEVRRTALDAGAVYATATFALKNGDKLPESYEIHADLYNGSSNLLRDDAVTAYVDNDKEEQSVEISFDTLVQNTAYRFRLWTPESGGKSYLYDSTSDSVGPYYDFQTVGGAHFGNDATNGVTFDPFSYDDRAVRLAYTLDQTRGFRMYYSVKALTGPAAGTLYGHAQLRRAVGDNEGLGLLSSAAEEPAPYKTVRFRYLPGNTFWVSGASYEISAVASTSAHSGNPADSSASTGYLGSVKYTFTMPQLGMPSFAAAVTPGYDANPAVSYFLDVTTLDIDTYKVITGEGKYKLRIFNESGEDVTGEDKKSVTHTADNTPNLTETFTGLSPGSQYTVRWYAVADTANAGNRPSIDAVAENYFAYANRTYVICESAVYTMDQNGVYVGRISASDGDLGGIRLVFAGSIGLDAVKRIQYTVTNSVDGNLTGKVDFNPAPLPGGVYSFELPPSVTDGAESTISLRFYTLDGQGNEIYINQPVSLYWYR